MEKIELFFNRIRNSHRLVVVISVGIYLFAFLHSSQIDYRVAQVELDLVRQINQHSLKGAVANYIEDILASEVGVEASVYVSVDQGSETLQVEEMIRSSIEDGNVIGRVLQSMYPEDDINFNNATLSQIRRAFSYPFFVPLPQHEELSAIAQCIKSAGTNYVRISVEFDEILFDLPVSGTISKTATAALRLVECVEFEFTVSSLSDLFSRFLSDADYSILSMLNSQYRLSKRRRAPFEMYEPTAWEVVEDRTIIEAKYELQRRIDAGARVEIFQNYRIDRRVMILTAPLVMMLSLMLLKLHLAKAVDVIEQKERIEFPWIGIYPDPESRAITLLSLVIMPSVAIFKFYSIYTAPIILRWSFTILLVALGAWIWWGLRYWIACEERNKNKETERSSELDK